jgi:hypothetical protein
MVLQGAAGEPAADALKRRPLDNFEAKQLLIEGDRLREIVQMTLTRWSTS